ncbi:GmrSD restriction endonuclease domain-containing protein [Paenibacillus sp. SN-8-1]|uniref:GmrSD restriction endonuclease domain-containing protein n=1 Tax=Paenibacillus sp. SN-8-1 TaxID=3435409 RepID=UPI003D9A45D2
MTNGELITGSISIDRLRNKIIEGEIKIPPFQRVFVWKKEQITDLMDSIYNDYPIGSVLLWEVNENLPALRNIGGYKLPNKTDEFPLNYILDGQQRITSIFGAFVGDEIEAEDETKTENFNIYFDLESERFVHFEDINTAHQNLKSSILFNVNEFFDEVVKLPSELREKARNLQSIFQNYELPTVTIKKRNKGEVGTIFERINNTGTPLSALELMIAWTWSEDYHLTNVFDQVYKLLEAKSFEDIKEKVILQCFGAIIKSTTVTKDILELNPDSIRDNSELLIKSIEKSLDYLQQEFNVISEDFLPKQQILVPLSFLFSKIHSPTANQNKIIKQWFWRVAYSDRYSSGTDKKMDEDIKFFEKILTNDFSGISKYSISINSDFFKTQKLSKSNSYVRAVLLMMSREVPLDLTNGTKIDTGVALSVYNKKEYHHIFPKAFLKGEFNLDDDKVNVIGNFCFLPSNSNKIISDKKPSNYFKNIIPQEHIIRILESNIIPTDITIYENDQYEAFLEARSRLLMEKVEKYISE